MDFLEDSNELILKHTVAPAMKIHNFTVNLSLEKCTRNEFSGAIFELVIACSTGLKRELKSEEENIFIKMTEKLQVALQAMMWGVTGRQFAYVCMLSLSNWSQASLQP